MEKNAAQDTISWQELKVFVSSFSKLIGRKMKKYWYVVLLVVLIPVVVFTAKTYFKEKEYQLQSTLGFHYSHQKLYGQFIAELNYLLSKARYDELNEKLGTQSIDWKKIHAIEAKNIFGYKLEEDMGPPEYPFYLIITGSTADALKPCSEAVVNYLNNHFSIIEKQQLELKILNEQKVFYSHQIGRIDSLLVGNNVVVHASDSGPVMASENAHLIELQDEYVRKLAEIEKDLLTIYPNIKVLSYGVVREF